MDKLEHYLDQVCRSVGGPRALRQHLRQELREHLQDAVTEHKAAGLSEAEALERALADFGGPDEVRAELEAAHGHRLLPVVIDKAMQWKERTMRARWLWTTWAYIATVGLIALELLFISFHVVFVLPKFQKLTQDGVIDPVIFEEQGLTWVPRFLNGLSDLVDHFTTWLLLAVAVLWGLFEWRVKTENKPFIRMSAFGTAAVGLLVVIVLMSGSLVVSFELGAPALGPMTRPWALEQVATIDAAVGGLKQALEKKDWAAMQEQAEKASAATGRLLKGPAVVALVPRGNGAQTNELRARLKSASERLAEAQQAIRDKDAGRLAAALKQFREVYGPVRDAAAAKPAG